MSACKDKLDPLSTEVSRLWTESQLTQKELHSYFEKIVYRPPLFNRQTKHTTSVVPIGLDTEAYADGRCFLICTSDGDTFSLKQIPAVFFSRKLRGSSFVCFNLKYDMGALLQCLPKSALKALRKEGEVEHDGYKWSVLGNRSMTIRRGKNSVHFYDVWPFFQTSLDKAAKAFLGRGKLEQDVTKYTREFVRRNRQSIIDYCVHDAKLARDLIRHFIKTVEEFGVFPQKLYSPASVSWTYFRTHCPYVHVKRYWDDHPDVLRYAMAAYNGGKFEVTRKGTGRFVEYDISSAYPYEIANLIDIRRARVCRERRYRKQAAYSFLEVVADIPMSLPSPVVVKAHNVCRFPSGVIHRVITKAEYEYLIQNGADVKIISAVHLLTEGREYPYRTEILRLTEMKKLYKAQNDLLKYQAVKLFLNSFYGKMVQLIEKKGKLHAGAAWNPIYGSDITARCRVRVSEMQKRFPSIQAVHTDSVITTEALPIEASGALGEWEYSVEGEGIILGTGIYQIGNKSRFRGFPCKKPLLELLPEKGKTLNAARWTATSWREVAHRDLSLREVNHFEERWRKLSIQFDSKRLWLNDWKDFKEVRKRPVESLPIVLLDARESAFTF